MASFFLPLNCWVESDIFEIDRTHTGNWKTQDIVGNVISYQEFTLDEISDSLLTISSEGTKLVIKSLNKRGEEIRRIQEQEAKHQLHENKVASLTFWGWVTKGATSFIGLCLIVIGIHFCIRHC